MLSERLHARPSKLWLKGYEAPASFGQERFWLMVGFPVAVFASRSAREAPPFQSQGTAIARLHRLRHPLCVPPLWARPRCSPPLPGLAATYSPPRAAAHGSAGGPSRRAAETGRETLRLICQAPCCSSHLRSAGVLQHILPPADFALQDLEAGGNTRPRVCTACRRQLPWPSF